MQSRMVSAILLVVMAGVADAAPPIELELATERGVQITAPREWLQLLTAIGIENVRIRGIKPGDQPRVDNHGTAERPSFRVVGIITAGNQLRLPGGTFSRADRGRLKDYFARLAADGAESLTAPRGLFGFTEKEIQAVFADLAQPINFETKGQSPRAVVKRLQATFAEDLIIDTAAERNLRDSTPVADELKGVTSGTGLAILLRSNGLALRPERSRGQPIVYRVVAGGSPAMTTTGGPPVATASAGKTADNNMKQWPIGWEPHGSPGEAAPALFESLNAEIDGYTLAETLAAIGPRVKIPMYLDHAALAAHDIDPSKIQVRLPRTRTSYKRIIDRALSHTRLGSQVRVDEAGQSFLWITR